LFYTPISRKHPFPYQSAVKTYKNVENLPGHYVPADQEEIKAYKEKLNAGTGK
jgi:hypothetical protein